MEEVWQIVCNWKFQVSHRMEFLEPIWVVHMMAEFSRNKEIDQNKKCVVYFEISRNIFMRYFDSLLEELSLLEFGIGYLVCLLVSMMV